MQDVHKNQDEKEIRLKEIGRIQNQGNLITKFSRNPKMESQDHTSRSKSPRGRTRRGHAPKRVARGARFAANPRQNSGFRGKTVTSGSQFSWATSSGTPRPSAPINISCSATYRASSVQQRAKVRIFRVFRFLVLFPLLYIFKS